MEAPELTSFGALIRHALALEEQAVAFYEQPAPEVSSEINSALGELAKAHRERRELLEKVRRELLSEMVLEPVDGLDGKAYIHTADPSRDRIALAKELEGVAERFYDDSARVARMVLAEAARVFERLARANRKNQERF